MEIGAPELQAILDDIAVRMAARTDRGKVASYIPQLARVDPDQFGIAIAFPDGAVLKAGDAEVPFSIQSISKVFTLAIDRRISGSSSTYRPASKKYR